MAEPAKKQEDLDNPPKESTNGDTKEKQPALSEQDQKIEKLSSHIKKLKKALELQKQTIGDQVIYHVLFVCILYRKKRSQSLRKKTQTLRKIWIKSPKKNKKQKTLKHK